jgi:hypothetical protein
MKMGKGGGILICNNIRDPLSMATRLAGNSNHASKGCYFPVDPPRLAEPAPANPKFYENKAPKTIAFFIRFGKAASHYHSIVKLAAYLKANPPGDQALSNFFKSGSLAKTA